jgi:predicted cupin superfamily sugar epimerase
LNAVEIIKHLGLKPHPEGGYYKRTYKNMLSNDERASASAIYYLLEGGSFSRWHRFDADELWLWHAGNPLTLELREGESTIELHLGNDLAAGQEFQILVPANQWQRARSEGEWTLVSCAVSPEFKFENYELED